MTFEEMLESQLQQASQPSEEENKVLKNSIQENMIQNETNENQEETRSPHRIREKKAFLRRGSSNKYNPSVKKSDTGKKYTYYADNFTTDKKNRTKEDEQNEKELKSPEVKAPSQDPSQKKF